jgi:micrococcal nuclease
MKRILAASLFVVVMTLLGFHQDVRAASLFGKVIEVNDGDVITVFNLNRPVKVRMLGIDAPEPGQPFAEVAKQHLKDLVLDKLVTVEYSGLGANSSIVGRVSVDGVDICAQMIRDGAAWFDVNNNNRLSDTDRQIYQHSEAAARNEKRGIWQSGAVTAPWEFTKAKARAVLETKNNGRTPQRTTRPGALSPEAVLGSGFVIAGTTPPGEWAAPIARQWRHFEPPGQNFSVFVPADGRKSVETTLFRDKPINTYAYMVRDSETVYAVIWMAGPYLGEIDEVIFPGAVAGILMGFNKGYETEGLAFRCEAKSPRTVAVKDYTAREFDLTGCHRRGVIRVHTKVIGEERQIITLISFYEQTEPNIRRFFNSFKSTALSQ